MKTSHTVAKITTPPRTRTFPDQVHDRGFVPAWSRSGFTLIELLVVIAIISILASMIFPTFSRAREAARKTVCISNLKQVGLGILQYNQDYDERFPIGLPFWDTTLAPSNPQLLLVRVLDPYIKSDQVWNCPSWKGVYTGNPTYIGNYSFLTGYDNKTPPQRNNVIGVPINVTPPLAPASLASLGQPSEYPLLFCGIAPQQDTSNSPATGYMNAHAAISDAAWRNGALGGDSILYGDGHAKYLPLDFGKWEKIYTTPLNP
jgi:prepilin-type N-terminal cleavage/methylation domain-containing protein